MTGALRARRRPNLHAGAPSAASAAASKTARAMRVSPASTPVLSAARARLSASSKASIMVRSGTAIELAKFKDGGLNLDHERERAVLLSVVFSRRALPVAAAVDYLAHVQGLSPARRKSSGYCGS